MHTTYYENQKIQKPQFIAEACFDYYNERLRIDDYRGNVNLLGLWVNEMAVNHNFHKVIIKSRQEDVSYWLLQGFIYEGVFSNYYNGTSAIAMCKYLTNERRNSSFWMEEDQLISNVQKLVTSISPNTLPLEYKMRMAEEKDALELAKLYGSVFEVYPTPMDHPEYVLEMIQTGTLFCLITHDEKLVSAASADVNKSYNNAEITDCATLVEHRKFGLMKHLIDKLENELFNRSIFCCYSIARALSFGMNAVFYQRGYEYKGRLANNCKIFDKYEDMNIWVKDLSI